MNNTVSPLVTIAIPTYNRADGHLKEALESALRQTYTNTEIIVSDNCSTDDTEKVVRSFFDKRIRYFRHEKNIGANNNFNFCLNNARGDFFLLLCDDDMIDPDFVEICMRADCHGTDVGIIRTGTRIIDTNGNVLSKRSNRVDGLSTTDFFIGWFTGKTSLYLCSTLFNTDRLKEIGGFKSKTNLFQDVVAEVQLAAKYGRVDIYDVKASFRRHPENMGSASKTTEWSEDCLYLLDLMSDLVSEDEDLIRQKGMPFLCRKVYLQARNIESPITRFLTYFSMYKKFDYSYSPFHFIWSRNLKRLATYFKNRM